MAFQEYDPGEGSVEDLFEQASGRAPKKKKKPGLAAELRANPEYQAAKRNAEKGMGQFADITFAEAVMFENGEARKPGVPQYQIKLGWTCAPPALIERTDRGANLMVRYIPLSVRTQARDNWRRKKSQYFCFQPDERKTVEEVLDVAKMLDARQDDSPQCLMGIVSHRFGIEGTIRHAQLGLVTWRAADDGWLPNLSLIQTYGGDVLSPRDRQTGERIGGIRMQPGRGKGVLAYGSYHSDDMLTYMKVPLVDAIVRGNLARLTEKVAA